MKKYILIFLICLYTINAKEYNLEYFINNFSNNSSNNTISQLKEESMSVQEKYIQYGKFNKLEIRANANYSKDYLSFEEDKSSSLQFNYGIFNLQLNYNFKDKEIDKKSIGFSKSLTDFIYSEEDYNKDVIKYDKLISNNEIESNRNQKIISIINQYGEIKKIEGELKIKKSTQKTNNKQYENLIIKYKYGNISKLELDLAKLRLANSESEINILKENLETAKKDLLIISEVDIKTNIQLLNIPETNFLNFNNAYIREINNLEYTKEKFILADKKEQRDNLPEVNLSGNYDIDSKIYQTGINFYKAIKFVDYQKYSTINNLKIAKLELEEEKRRRKNKIEKLKTKYNQLITQYNILVREKTYKEKEVFIQKKKFEDGMINFIEYTENTNEFEKILIDLYDIEQDISIFKYTLKYL